MRKIAIVGAGHAGLHLGNLLLANQGFQVSIYTNRSGDEIARGPILSSQSMYGTAVQMERDAGLALWDAPCPTIDGFHVRLGTAEAGVLLPIDYRLTSGAGQSVDQRIKFPAWMQEFERRGGTLVIRDVGLADLEALAAGHDLVLMATGKGELKELFPIDPARNQMPGPIRTIALTYVHGMQPNADYGAINLNVNPGVGEFIHFPGLTLSGPCDIINLEAVVGGPADRFLTGRTLSPQQHFELTMDLIRQFFPWEASRFANARLTDDKAVLAGRLPPTVRQPIATLPSGRKVMAIGDIFVLNDPATGQGSNNASKFAVLVADAIVRRGRDAFDEAWMKSVTDRFWNETARWSHTLVNSFLLPPKPYMEKVLGSAAGNPRIASALFEGFNDPALLKDWFFDESGAAKKLQELA